jgi:hypothetical protein
MHRSHPRHPQLSVISRSARKPTPLSPFLCLRCFLSSFILFVSAFASAFAANKNPLSAPLVYTGAYDGSAAAMLDTSFFVTASDEDSTLRIYRRDQSGSPLQAIDLSSFLEVNPAKPETDIEAAARIDNRIYWISSHARNQRGLLKPEHQRFFATEALTNNSTPNLRPIGKPYENLLPDLSRAPQLGAFNLADAASRAPKASGGLSIEGLCATPEGSLLIGFRNPVPDQKALLIPLLNPGEVIEGIPARFGAPIQLDLDGLGIRDIAYWNGEYLGLTCD